MLGGIALRHGDSDFIRWAGNVGYGIRPSARRGGLATWALGQMMSHARLLGMNRVLLVCAADNKGSAATIELNADRSRASKKQSTVQRVATGLLPLSWTATVTAGRLSAQSVSGRQSAWPTASWTA